MTSRRSLFGAVGVAIAAAAQPQGNHAETIHRQALPAPFNGWEAEFVHVTAAPGPGFAPHHHNGFVLGYVIDGAFRFAIDGEAEHVLHAGEVFYEPPGVLHSVTASADARKNARVLAIVISEKKHG